MIRATPPRLSSPAPTSRAASSRTGEILDYLAVAVEREARGRQRYPALDPVEKLAHRQSIEKLVSDQHQRSALRQALEAVVPLGVRVRLPLDLAQHRARLDEMHSAIETRAAHHPQRVARQRPASRPELDVDRIRGRAGAGPAIGERGADHLPEHLADFRSGSEIAGRAQGIAGRVIIRVAGFHKGFDGDRPFRLDPLPQRPFQRCQAHPPACGRQLKQRSPYRPSLRPARDDSALSTSGRVRPKSSAATATGPCADGSPE